MASTGTGTDTRISAWDVEAERGIEFAADAVDSGWASWFTLPVTDAGRAAKLVAEAEDAGDALLAP